MARPLRIEFPGALYHVTARGNARAPIFLDDSDRERFLKLLAQVVDRFSFRVYAYCLMDNHYHLVVETPRGNLAAGMRHLNGVYSQALNRHRARGGHLFEGRYKAILVEKESHLLTLARYIVLNPVRARLCAHPGEWPWSSYAATAGHAPPLPFLTVEEILGNFGPHRRRARERYRAFVADEIGDDPFRGLRGQIYLGSEQFIAQHAGERAALKEVPRPQWQPLRPSLTDVFAAEGKRGILVANRRWGYSLRAIADHLECHISTVSRRLSRLEADGA